jgi:hypothetical protein
MKIPKYDEVVGGEYKNWREYNTVTQNGFDFLLSGPAAYTRLANGKWLIINFDLDSGTSWRLVGNFDRKAELYVSLTDEVVDEPAGASTIRLISGGIKDTDELRGGDLEKLIPIIEAAFVVLVRTIKEYRASQEVVAVAKSQADKDKAAAELAKLKNKGL